MTGIVAKSKVSPITKKKKCPLWLNEEIELEYGLFDDYNSYQFDSLTHGLERYYHLKSLAPVIINLRAGYFNEPSLIKGELEDDSKFYKIGLLELSNNRQPTVVFIFEDGVAKMNLRYHIVSSLNEFDEGDELKQNYPSVDEDEELFDVEEVEPSEEERKKEAAFLTSVDGYFTKFNQAFVALSGTEGFIKRMSAIVEPFRYVAPLIKMVCSPRKYIYTTSKNIDDSLELRQSPMPVSQLLIEENYSEEVVSRCKNIINELNKEKPFGKIAILQGEPGTGKSYMLRYFIEKFEDYLVVLVNPQTIANTGGDSSAFRDLVMDNASAGNKLVLFLEDADEILSPRTDGNMGAVSQLLNMGDGIIGDVFDVRIIATTNAKIEQFDDAITRPGRLVDLVNIDALTHEESETRWRSMTGDEEAFLERTDRENGGYTIAELYFKQHELNKTQKETND